VSGASLELSGSASVGSARSGDRIATADPDVLAVAEAEKLDSIVLPGQA
jgi:hypothetical protein